MHIRPAAAALLTGGLLVLGTASPAAAVCDAYSGNCVPGPSSSPSVRPTTIDRDTDSSDDTATDAATLPFTGGELVLMTALGAGALAGGTALVIAGRRRKPDAAA